MGGVDVADKGGRRSANTDLNMVPFIDLLMVTLAFLLITAVWVQNSRLNANALVPDDPTKPITDVPVEKALHVHVGADDFVLTWKEGATVVSETRVPRETAQDGRTHFPALTRRIAEEWTRHGSHQNPADARVDQAVLHTDNQLPFRDIVAVMDAVYSTKRELKGTGASQQIPAMNVTFAVR